MCQSKRHKIRTSHEPPVLLGSEGQTHAEELGEAVGAASRDDGLVGNLVELFLPTIRCLWRLTEAAVEAVDGTGAKSAGRRWLAAQGQVKGG